MQIKKFILSNAFLTKLAIYFRKLYLKRRFSINYGKSSLIGFSVIIEGRNSFGNNSSITSSKIGYGSYIGNNSKFAKSSIGRYCSIGSNVSCIFGRHPSHTFVSTHPAFFSVSHPISISYVKEQSFEEFAKPRDLDGKYSIVIGNDVWIGENAAIMEGVVIGDGAIVAANSLVTKDVDPYMIVGGVPAKIIKSRFEKDDIEFLLSLKWWDKPQSWLKKNGASFKNIKELKKNS